MTSYSIIPVIRVKHCNDSLLYTLPSESFNLVYIFVIFEPGRQTLYGIQNAAPANVITCVCDLALIGRSTQEGELHPDADQAQFLH